MSHGVARMVFFLTYLCSFEHKKGSGLKSNFAQKCLPHGIVYNVCLSVITLETLTGAARKIVIVTAIDDFDLDYDFNVDQIMILNVCV